MSSLLGSLRVRLSVETADFRAGLEGAKANLQTFEKAITKFSKSTIAQFASIGAVAGVLKASLDASKEYETATNALASSARLAGQDLASLQTVVTDAQQQFGLGKTMANDFGLELSRLADRVGGLADPMKTLQAFLDLGAARGLDAAKSLDAMQKAIKGDDDAVSLLLNRKADGFFDKFAASVGTTTDRLSDQGKAQAILNAVMADGEGARGAYAGWLDTVAGRQFLFTQRMNDSTTTMGQSSKPAIVGLTPVMDRLASAISTMAVGFTALIADLILLPQLGKSWGQAFAFQFSASKKTFEDGQAAWKAMVDEAKALATNPTAAPGGAFAPNPAPPPISGRGQGGNTKPPATAPDTTANDRRQIFIEDAIEKAKEQNALDVEALGAQATLTDKLQLQLDLQKQIYEIKKLAAEEDDKLTTGGKQNAELKAKLEEETAEFQLKGEASAERAQQAQEQATKKQTSHIGAIGDAVASLASGSFSGAGLGSTLGTLAGSWMPALAPFTASIGGMIGGLFDRNKKESDAQQTPIVKGLDAIERAQKETITTIQAQTDALLKPENRLMNLPSTFNVPSYRPDVGSSSYSQTVNLALTVNAPSGNAADIQAVVRKSLADVLNAQRRASAWNASFA